MTTTDTAPSAAEAPPTLATETVRVTRRNWHWGIQELAVQGRLNISARAERLLNRTYGHCHEYGQHRYAQASLSWVRAAQLLGCAKNTAGETIAELVEAGLWTPVVGGRRGKGTIYAYCLPTDVAAEVEAQSMRLKVENAAQNETDAAQSGRDTAQSGPNTAQSNSPDQQVSVHNSVNAGNAVNRVTDAGDLGGSPGEPTGSPAPASSPQEIVDLWSRDYKLFRFDTTRVDADWEMGENLAETVSFDEGEWGIEPLLWFCACYWWRIYDNFHDWLKDYVREHGVPWREGATESTAKAHLKRLRIFWDGVEWESFQYDPVDIQRLHNRFLDLAHFVNTSEYDVVDRWGNVKSVWDITDVGELERIIEAMTAEVDEQTRNPAIKRLAAKAAQLSDHQLEDARSQHPDLPRYEGQINGHLLNPFQLYRLEDTIDQIAAQ